MRRLIRILFRRKALTIVNVFGMDKKPPLARRYIRGQSRPKEPSYKAMRKALGLRP